MSNFETKCKNCNICTSIARLGSRCVSKEAENFKELEYLGFSVCFSVRIEKSPKLIKKNKKNTISGRLFKVYSVLTVKQQLKPKNSRSLKFSASFDTHLDPKGAILVEVLEFLHFVSKFDNSGAPYMFFFLFSK